MASVSFDKATRIYPKTEKPAVDALDLDDRGRRVPRPRRSLRLRQVHQPAHARRPRGDRRGSIHIGDRDVTDLPPKDRDIAMVFQNYALYPHMTVAENMGFALKIAGVNKSEIAARVARRRQDPRPRALPRAQAQGALRWPAPACRHGPGDRPQAAGVPHGRAAVQPRRQAARLHPYPDRLAAAPPRRHHRLRHPRPGRGHDDGRPGGRAQGRAAPAVRHARASCTRPRTTSSSPASWARRR